MMFVRDRGMHRSDPVPLIVRLAGWVRPVRDGLVQPAAVRTAPARPAVCRHEVADTRTDLPVVPGFMRRQPWIGQPPSPGTEVGDDTLAMLRGWA